MKSMRERYVKEFLDIIILSILRNEPRCGFDIIQFINKNFDVLLSAGSVYPILHSLKKKNFLKTKKDRRKIVYTITERGKRSFNDMLNGFEENHKLVLKLTKKRRFFS